MVDLYQGINGAEVLHLAGDALTEHCLEGSTMF